MSKKVWYPEADSVILHGKIYTVAITCEEVKAGKYDFPIIDDGGVAIKDGKIIAVGKSSEMKAVIGDNTKVIDATGKVICPGFCESHMHASFYGLGLLVLDLEHMTKRTELAERLAAYAKNVEAGKWIRGNGWNELVWEDDQTLYTCKELDEICPDNPVFLMSMTYHTAFVNSAAMKIAGITKDTPNPGGGTIGHFENGEPNGVLYENSAMNLVQQVMPPMTDDDLVEALLAAGKVMSGFGITSAVDANLSYDQLRAYKLALEQGKLLYRANPMFYLDSALGDAEYHLRRMDEHQCVTGFGNDMLKLNGIKVTLDGVPATFTATMREPYRMDPTTCGSSVWTQEEITAFVCKANEKGWQFGIHTIGDKASDMAIEAFAAAHAQKPINDKRNYLIHYCLPHEDQWDKMKEMNISATQQPTIACTLGEAAILYEEQAMINQGCGRLFNAGILVGGSSDCPVVTCDPLTGMYYAVTRYDETTGKVLGEECKVTPQQALIMWTKNGAYFTHDDDKMGSVEVGNLADVLIIDREFITDDPKDIMNAKVETTILGGEVVYQA